MNRNSNRKAKDLKRKQVKFLNISLLLATLLVSLVGFQVEAASRSKTVVVKITAVPIKPEEKEEESEAVEEIAEEESIVAETYLSSPDILETLSDEELYFLAQCVQIEAGGESEEGMIAVASVLINRKNREDFPNSFKEVVTQKLGGVYQFSSYGCSLWGTKTISSEVYGAIRKALTEGSNVGNATYFANLSVVKSGWFYTAQEDGTLEKVAEIGGHTFFKTKN